MSSFGSANSIAQNGGLSTHQASVLGRAADSDLSRKFIAANWKLIEKNTLLGVFDLRLPSGMTIARVQLHAKGDSRWISLPGSRYTEADGRQEWAKIIDFVEHKAQAKFQERAKEAIDDLLGGES